MPRHFFIFNKANFTALARECGYVVVATRSIINPVAWIHSLKSICAERIPWLAGFFHAQNPLMLVPATLLDLVQTRVFWKSSNMQIFLMKPKESR
jgi:hypothetical protein